MFENCKLFALKMFHLKNDKGLNFVYAFAYDKNGVAVDFLLLLLLLLYCFCCFFLRKMLFTSKLNFNFSMHRHLGNFHAIHFARWCIANCVCLSDSIVVANQQARSRVYAWYWLSLGQWGTKHISWNKIWRWTWWRTQRAREKRKWSPKTNQQSILHIFIYYVIWYYIMGSIEQKTLTLSRLQCVHYYHIYNLHIHNMHNDDGRGRYEPSQVKSSQIESSQADSSWAEPSWIELSRELSWMVIIHNVFCIEHTRSIHKIFSDINGIIFTRTRAHFYIFIIIIVHCINTMDWNAVWLKGSSS